MGQGAVRSTNSARPFGTVPYSLRSPNPVPGFGPSGDDHIAQVWRGGLAVLASADRRLSPEWPSRHVDEQVELPRRELSPNRRLSAPALAGRRSRGRTGEHRQGHARLCVEVRPDAGAVFPHQHDAGVRRGSQDAPRQPHGVRQGRQRLQQASQPSRLDPEDRILERQPGAALARRAHRGRRERVETNPVPLSSRNAASRSRSLPCIWLARRWRSDEAVIRITTPDTARGTDRRVPDGADM